MRQLHRSLFLQTTGRFIIGVTSLAMLFLIISGMLLLIQRQGGLKKSFLTIKNLNLDQYWHITLARIFFVPIFIIAFTGVVLFVNRVSGHQITISDAYGNSSAESIKHFSEFKIFTKTKASDIVQLDFPFFEDVEEYYRLQLQDRILSINQFSGEIVPLWKRGDRLSYLLSPLIQHLQIPYCSCYTARS